MLPLLGCISERRFLSGGQDPVLVGFQHSTLVYSSVSSTTRPPCSQIVVYVKQDGTESLSTSFEARRLNLIIKYVASL